MEKYNLYYQDKRAELVDNALFGTKEYPISKMVDSTFSVEDKLVKILAFDPRLLRFKSLENLRFYLFDSNRDVGYFVNPVYSDFVKNEIDKYCPMEIDL